MVLYFIYLLVCFLFYQYITLIHNALCVKFQISTINRAYLEKKILIFRWLMTLI